MVVSLTHKFISAKGDGSDATLVRPTNWNDEHALVLATSKLLGRMTAGTGDVEELPVTSYMVNLLNTADYASLAAALGLPTTGDARLTYKPGPDAGWIFANDGTIGDVGSGSTVASFTTLALFTLFYDTMEYATPLQTLSGATTTRAAQGTAAQAFAAKCRMVIPKSLGRALITGGGIGAGLTGRYAGQSGGSETHTLVQAEAPDHVHTTPVTGSTSGVLYGVGYGTGTGYGTGAGTAYGEIHADTGNESADHAHHTTSTGSTGYMDRSIDHLHGVNGATQSMNRSNPHSHGVNGGVWGGSTHNWVNSAVYYDGPVGAAVIGINNTDINHEHGISFTSGASDRDLNHTHGGVSVAAWSGGRSAAHSHRLDVGMTSSVNVTSLAVTVNSNTINVQIPSGVLSVSATGTSNGAQGYGNQPHNNMQPWTAWNVMIRL